MIKLIQNLNTNLNYKMSLRNYELPKMYPNSLTWNVYYDDYLSVIFDN